MKKPDGAPFALSTHALWGTEVRRSTLDDDDSGYALELIDIMKQTRVASVHLRLRVRPSHNLMALGCLDCGFSLSLVEGTDTNIITAVAMSHLVLHMQEMYASYDDYLKGEPS